MTPNPTVDTKNMFQCGLCQRHYKRLDHLARHVRSHTQNRPHKCHICPKAFTRTDLLKRHVAGHASPGKESSSRPDNSTPSRVTKACRTCASNHLRCTETKPCSRCVEKGLDCVWYNQPDDSDRDSADEEEDTIMRSDPGPQSDSVVHTDDNGTVSVDPIIDMVDAAAGDHSQYVSRPEDARPMAGPPTATSGIFSPVPTLLQPHSSSHAPSFEPNYLFSDFPDLRLLSGSWASPGPLGLGFETATELDDMDLRFLDTYNISIPFECGGISETGLGSRNDVQDSSSSSSNEIRAEAFRNFQWRFRPSANDHGGAEEHNLSLPEANDNTSPESRLSVNLRMTCARLEVATRDRILTIVVKSCRPGNLSKAVSSFPSVELLDSLLQYYLASPVARSDSFIHAPTFDPNKKRPELVAAMAAAGAVLTSDPALTKLGYAIQESWEQDNTMVRDLQLSQGFLMTLDVGMWSGHSRKVEIAESFLQPLLTMLRRDNKFKKSRYPEVFLDPAVNGAELEQAWHAWVESESWKRLTFRLLHHDTNSSMALLVNPLISYAEVQLPLPASADLWSASSPQQWKDSVLARSTLRRLSLPDYLDDPEAVNSLAVDADSLLSRQAFLSCAWSLTWEHIQMSSLQRSKPRRWNALVMATRRDEIVKLLNYFQISMDVSLPSASSLELLMRLELILLHLNTPFEDLQTFAGIEGPEQARAVYLAVIEWAHSESARKAVWHAGQVVRMTRQLPPGTIRAFTAIMLYHASLAFWVYGLASEKPDMAEQWTDSPSTPGSRVWLDEPDSIAMQRFIQLGSGLPLIHGVAGDGSVNGVCLWNPDQVMEAVLATLKANFEDGPRPLLVDKMIQLMTGLQRSSRSAGGQSNWSTS